ncbi:hypothetical protein C8J56DRAFT_879928 [Mycena floridula]|nr:hypothetical protein C8J56DRAFT_879928 [Mycena floridula]
MVRNVDPLGQKKGSGAIMGRFSSSTGQLWHGMEIISLESRVLSRVLPSGARPKRSRTSRWFWRLMRWGGRNERGEGSEAKQSKILDVVHISINRCGILLTGPWVVSRESRLESERDCKVVSADSNFFLVSRSSCNEQFHGRSCFEQIEERPGTYMRMLVLFNDLFHELRESLKCLMAIAVVENQSKYYQWSVSRPPPGSRPFTNYSMAAGLVVELGVGIRNRQSDLNQFLLRSHYRGHDACPRPLAPFCNVYSVKIRIQSPMVAGLSSWFMLHFPSHRPFKQAEQTGSLKAATETLSTTAGHDHVPPWSIDGLLILRLLRSPPSRPIDGFVQLNFLISIAAAKAKVSD